MNRAKSTTANVITPLAFSNKPNNKPLILTKDSKHGAPEEADTSDEDEYRETSRFGERQNKFKTIDHVKPILRNRAINEKAPREEKKNDFSDFTDSNISKILDLQNPDETLSLSNMTKEHIHKNKPAKHSKKKKKYEILEKIKNAKTYKKGVSQISKIEKQNNSGLSHSYDFFTNTNITPIPDHYNPSSYTNNRYALREDVSKSELSASLMMNPNRYLEMRESMKKHDHTPPPAYGSYNQPLVDLRDNQKVLIQNASRGMSFDNVSKSGSEMSQAKASVSRIFQPSPQRLPPLDKN